MQSVEKRAVSGSFTGAMLSFGFDYMARSRLPDVSARVRRTAAAPTLLPEAADHVASARHLLLHSWAGRLFMGAAALKVVFGVVRQVGELPTFVRVINTAATLALAVSV